MTNSTTQPTTTSGSTAQKPWNGFEYVPVRGLSDRRISRFLRTQRKNMRRFFAERGLFDELEKMERIRKSRQGMMAKNRMFQKVLDDYATRVSPKPNVSGAESGTTPGPIGETPHQEAEGSSNVAVHAPAESGGAAPVLDTGSRPYTGGSVPGVAPSDSAEPVIEEPGIDYPYESDYT